MLVDARKMLDSLMNYDKENIPEKVIKKITEYVENDQFTPEVIAKVSKACTAICQWVHAMYTFHNVNNSIEPKREALASSQAELKVATAAAAVEARAHGRPLREMGSEQLLRSLCWSIRTHETPREAHR